MFDVIVPIYKVKPIYLERCLKTISYDIQREYFEGDYKIFLIDKWQCVVKYMNGQT